MPGYPQAAFSIFGMSRRVYAIVLAAGRATRFGAVKQLAPIGGKPMLRRATAAAVSTCGERTIVVTGHESLSIAAACKGLPGFLVVNENYRSGIGTSIATAVRRLEHVAAAVVVTLADQPLVTGEHLNALVAAWSGGATEIVASGFAGTLGPPVLFASGCFADLAALEGDNGGRELLHDARFVVTTVQFEPAAIDIDTPEDLRRI